MQVSAPTGRASKIGIDLGTANTLVVALDEGVIFDQPSVCCFQGYDAVPRFIAAGTEASGYQGRVSRPFKIVRPLKAGVLSDMAATRELLHFVQKSSVRPRHFRRLHPRIGIPADATESERRALTSAAVDAGFGKPELIPEPLLAAIGLGLDIHAPRGRMVVDCGAGTVEAAVISLGSICLTNSVRGGGEALDQALREHLSFKRRFQIGPAAAEAMKLSLSEIIAAGDLDQNVEVKGLDTASGLPRLLVLQAAEFLPVWLKHVDDIVSLVRSTLRDTLPELSQDILEDGVTLTGGGAHSAMLASRILESTGVKTHVADASRFCVARGLQVLLQQDLAGHA